MFKLTSKNHISAGRRVIQQIDSYEIVEDDEELYKVFWNGSTTGKFTIKSTLKIVRGDLEMGATTNWNYVWKLPVPQCIRFCLWLVLHNHLMSNENRFIRKLTEDSRCLLCGEVAENVDHILRKWPIATLVWRKFPGLNDHEIFCKPLAGWITQNIGHDTTRDEQWPFVFCTTIWW